MKSQPLAYNKDNQEDKEPLFDLLDTSKDCLFAYSEMMPAVSCKKENMRAAAQQGYATATDLADYLVKRGLPFRDAHEVVGKSVAFGIAEGRDLAELSLDELRGFSELIEAGRIRSAYPGRLVECPRSPRRHRAAAGTDCRGHGAQSG
jgi:argininosuccinate lyase